MHNVDNGIYEQWISKDAKGEGLWPNLYAIYQEVLEIRTKTLDQDNLFAGRNTKQKLLSAPPEHYVTNDIH
jgi:hypothetical protein